jgi:hypothetical protein
MTMLYIQQGGNVLLHQAQAESYVREAEPILREGVVMVKEDEIFFCPVPFGCSHWHSEEYHSHDLGVCYWHDIDSLSAAEAIHLFQSVSAQKAVEEKTGYKIAYSPEYVPADKESAESMEEEYFRYHGLKNANVHEVGQIFYDSFRES